MAESQKPLEQEETFYLAKNNSRKSKKANTDFHSQRKILLVDDSMKAMAPLNMVFQNLGCETVISFDSQSAVENILSHPPDLIILDWMLPEANGGETLEWAQNALRFNYGDQILSFGKIPVVTFSSKALEEIVCPDCTNFHYLDHWQKPMSVSQLTKEANNVLFG